MDMGLCMCIHGCFCMYTYLCAKVRGYPVSSSIAINLMIGRGSFTEPGANLLGYADSCGDVPVSALPAWGLQMYTIHE